MIIMLTLVILITLVMAIVTIVSNAPKGNGIGATGS